MPDILIRGVRAETIRRLKLRAKRNGRSLQGEAKMLIEQGGGHGREEIAVVLDRWERRFAGRKMARSLALLREEPQAMKQCVVDASVVATAFFHEEYAEAARHLLLSDTSLHAPDLICAELASVVWKRHRRGELAEEEAIKLLTDMLALPLIVASSRELADGALQAALRTGRTVYDCLYLALCVKLETVMVTADRRLVNALAGGPLEKHIVWIGDPSCARY